MSPINSTKNMAYIRCYLMASRIYERDFSEPRVQNQFEIMFDNR